MGRRGIDTAFVCTACGAAAPKWLGRCPGCAAWGTFTPSAAAPSCEAGTVDGLRAITAIEADANVRIASGMAALDAVLGGGWVHGASALLAGEPGIGKSTLLLQAAAAFARAGRRVLYASGEETAAQVQLRAQRLGALAEGVSVLASTDVSAIVGALAASRAQLVVVDSIQTVRSAEADALAGSPSQVRDCAARLIAAGKASGATVLLVGHVTKDGQIAGPKLLEHLVDVVLTFGGDSSSSCRVLRSSKNRFGATDEVVFFAMAASGLHAVADPAELLGVPSAEPGAALAAVVEGSRAYLIEIQALVGPVSERTPHVRASGFEASRVALVAAVLERHSALQFGRRDLFVKTAGGVEVVDPAGDLALAMALWSTATERAPRAMLAFAGELALTGEVRRVNACALRMREAQRRVGGRRLVVAEGTQAEGAEDAERAAVVTVARRADGGSGHDRLVRIRHVRDLQALLAEKNRFE